MQWLFTRLQDLHHDYLSHLDLPFGSAKTSRLANALHLQHVTTRTTPIICFDQVIIVALTTL